MAYSFQTFSVGEILTATKMNQVEVNIRDHVHGTASVVSVPNSGLSGHPWGTSDLQDNAITNAKLADFVAGSYTEIGIGDNTDADPGTSYVQKIAFYMPRGGTITTHMHLWAPSGATAYGRVYVNGSAVGTERSTTSSLRQAWNEDISFNAGDVIQLYVRNSNAGFGTSYGLHLRTNGATSTGITFTEDSVESSTGSRVL